MQQLLFGVAQPADAFKSQLLKWVGNKQRFASEIISFFPRQFGCYFEPFLGSGGVLGSLAPPDAVASDAFGPLVEIWDALRNTPDVLKEWYGDRWNKFTSGNNKSEYEKIKAAYNINPNGADLVFLCRSCYGGVVRFRQADGYMSTPCGIHRPITPEAFAKRVDQWHERTRHTRFLHLDFEEALEMTKMGDLVYCDPPYSHSQTILYGAQAFSLARLFDAIERCKSRGVYVALSIDGTKKSGDHICDIPLPHGLFQSEFSVHCGRSMLKRFQMEGRSLEDETVSDRLLLTY